MCGGKGLSGERLTGPGSSLQGVGTVVSGTTLRGLIKLNDTLLLGPDPLGNFLSIAVKSIHRKRMPVKEVRGGQTASFALKKVSVGNTLTPLRVRVLLGSGRLHPHGCSASQGLLTSPAEEETELSPPE